MTYDIVVLTDREHAYPDHIDDYTKNVITEDALVLNALHKVGLKAIRLPWDDPDFDWSDTKAVLFRTTWDYFERFDEFMSWLHKLAQNTRLINSESLIRWNIDKHYLLDLKVQGIHIAETCFIEPRTDITLAALHRQTGWTETVLKPCISGAARHTYLLNLDNLNAHEALFSDLIKQEAMMMEIEMAKENNLLLVIFCFLLWYW